MPKPIRAQQLHRLRVTGWILLLGILVGMQLVGCASVGTPVVADHSPVFGTMPAAYRVRAGDTLYSIAWRYGLDVAELARFNGLDQPFTIYPQQRLLLRSPPKSTVQAKPPSTRKPKPAAAKPPQKVRVVGVKTQALDWAWPVKASPFLRYGEQGSGGASRGLYYELPDRTQVRAAAAGKVVYAGPGLGGYERLIIVDHGQALLSAYGFHGSAKVQEQQLVKTGVPLADTLGSNARFSRFHFEVRKQGQPINPQGLILP